MARLVLTSPGGPHPVEAEARADLQRSPHLRLVLAVGGDAGLHDGGGPGEAVVDRKGAGVDQRAVGEVGDDAGDAQESLGDGEAGAGGDPTLLELTGAEGDEVHQEAPLLHGADRCLLYTSEAA